MPLYGYRCTKCGHQFEKIQSFNAEPETECPKCHGVLMRPLTAPALQFKGAGWYVNDYAPKSAASSSDAKPSDTNAAPSGDAKPAASDSPTKPAASSESAPTSASADSATKSTTPSSTAE
ncbi:MAG: FmdB family zinc ribbon protein [Terracidiphilus sp.]